MEAADLASRRVKEAATGKGAQTVKEAATDDLGAKGEGGSGRSPGLADPVVPNHLETGSGANDLGATTSDDHRCSATKKRPPELRDEEDPPEISRI
uniref:Uncharacterized protein n=1 Tax=Oryza barthii TaxID=65489 RepID=A0A0D3HNU0_9ORYZ